MTVNPAPSGHYALAVRREGWLFVAGQTGEDAHGALGGLAEQIGGAVANIAAILSAHGASLDDVVRMTCYVAGLPDAGVFAEFDRAYSEALGDRHPARTTVGVVGLPAGELVEIEATAQLPANST